MENITAQPSRGNSVAALLWVKRIVFLIRLMIKLPAWRKLFPFKIVGGGQRGIAISRFGGWYLKAFGYFTIFSEDRSVIIP